MTDDDGAFISTHICEQLKVPINKNKVFQNIKLFIWYGSM